jgi:PTH1 family peptidyl-tRNA hydrolase
MLCKQESSGKQKKGACKSCEWYIFVMQWIVAGLGNPGSEYDGTRHNVGRDFLRALEKKIPKKIKIILPDTYMNDSGAAFKKIITSKKAAESLVVLHDELDLPLGVVKFSFGSGAGGHRGVLSIQQALKTKDFIRIRIGISPATPSGKIKKPDAEKTVDFVLGTFKPTEVVKLKKVQKTVADALELLFTEGLDKARTQINSRA